MEILTNGIITIGIKEHGAELSSLKAKDREYLWQADKSFWQRHSPVLFPIVGALWNGEFKTKGETYKMGQHGFARDMVFTLVDKSNDEIRYRLNSSKETLSKFPYEFCLEIGYKLIENKVSVIWNVINTGNEPLPFQIGAHPAFFWPLLSSEVIDEGIDKMCDILNGTDNRGYFKLESVNKDIPISVITESGCVGKTSMVNIDDNGYLPINVHTFDNDALIFENSLISKVTLCDEHKTPYISLEFTSPLVGLWSPPKKRAPFVCIEPWYGRTDEVGFNSEFKDKKWMQTLSPKQTFSAHYDIIIEGC